MEKRPGQNGGARASMGQGRRAAEAPKSSVPSESFIVGGEYGFAVAEGGHSLEAGPGCTSPRSASGAGGAGKAAGPPGPGCPPVAGACWGPPAPTHVQKVSFPHVTPVSPARLPGPPRESCEGRPVCLGQAVGASPLRGRRCGEEGRLQSLGHVVPCTPPPRGVRAPPGREWHPGAVSLRVLLLSLQVCPRVPFLLGTLVHRSGQDFLH